MRINSSDLEYIADSTGALRHVHLSPVNCTGPLLGLKKLAGCNRNLIRFTTSLGHLSIVRKLWNVIYSLMICDSFRELVLLDRIGDDQEWEARFKNICVRLFSLIGCS